MENTKYQVRWNKGKAHLSENGTKTFCGQKIQGWGWTVDQPATISEFLKEVKPKCSGCKLGAQTHELLDDFTNN